MLGQPINKKPNKERILLKEYIEKQHASKLVFSLCHINMTVLIIFIQDR